jgi:hypothetical protein
MSYVVCERGTLHVLTINNRVLTEDLVSLRAVPVRLTGVFIGGITMNELS